MARLTEAQRMVIVAARSQGISAIELARKYGVSRQAITSICKPVKQADPIIKEWREKLFNQLPTKATEAIERSLDDTAEVHKAAATAIPYLKGVGVFQPDPNTQVNVFLKRIADLPPDWRSQYVTTDDGEDPDGESG